MITSKALASLTESALVKASYTLKMTITEFYLFTKYIAHNSGYSMLINFYDLYMSQL